MAETVKISALTASTDAQMTDAALLETSVVDSGTSTGFASKRTTFSRFANYILNKFTGLSLAGSSQTVKSAVDGLNTSLASKADTSDIPTKTSDLNNDSGYITDAGVTSFNGSTGAVTYTAPVTSVNGSTGAVTVSVPTKTSDLSNDSGFITSASLSALTDVTLTNPSDNQALTYDSANSKWVNSTISGGGSVTVDSAMSSSSTNPVQNAVIYAALADKASTSVATTSANGLMSATDKANLDTVYADYSSALTALGVS